MEKEYSLDKVQLLFSTQTLDKDMVNILRKTTLAPEINTGFRTEAMETGADVMAESFF